jgi:iron-sulfur cluster assembly protein
MMNVNTQNFEKLSLTGAAAKRVSKQIAEADSAMGLRFIVKESGCSGYSYFMELADQVDQGESVIESNGVKIVTNEYSLSLISGTQIDYVTEGLNQTFKFINPSADAHCGCGESFAV